MSSSQKSKSSSSASSSASGSAPTFNLSLGSRVLPAIESVRKDERGNYIIGDQELRGAKAREGLSTEVQYAHVGGTGQGLESQGAGPSASSGGVGGSGAR